MCHPLLDVSGHSLLMRLLPAILSERRDDAPHHKVVSPKTE